MAHKKTRTDGRFRVILIVYGDIDCAQMDNVNEEFRLYMKTHTYIKWDDPWFMKKILYAMPHKRHRRNARSMELSDLIGECIEMT